jgi:pimeloyl-ACP methyl ester carboxylesterase
MRLALVLMTLALTSRPEQGFVNTEDGIRLFYRKVGHGPIRVIAPYDLMMFGALRPLADIATIVTYDTRNRGRSDASPDASRSTIQQEARDLEAVRRHFKFETFVLIGFSYLGKAAALYAIDHPARVSRIVQIAPSPIQEEAAADDVDADLLGAPPADVALMRRMRLGDAKSKSPREFCNAEWNVTRYMLVGDPANASKIPVRDICSRANEWPVNAEKRLGPLWDSVEKTVPTAAQLKTITMPVLTIHGTKDRNAAYKGGRKWVAALPNARLVSVSGAGHAVWVDNPKVVFTAMRSFLRGEWPTVSEPVNGE